MKTPAVLFARLCVLVKFGAADSIIVVEQPYTYTEASLSFPSLPAPSSVMTFEGCGDSSQMGILSITAFFCAILIAWSV